VGGAAKAEAMGALRRAALGLCAAAALTAPPAQGAVLSVRTSFEPATARFGDRILARVDVVADGRAVDAGALRVTEDVAPLAQLGAARVSRSSHGGVVTVTYELPVACLGEACLSARGPALLHLPRARVEAPRRGGGVLRRTASWPTLAVRGRVTAADLQPSKPRFRRDTSPPAVTYRFAPRTLARALDAVALLLALAAAALAAFHVRGVVRRRRALDTRTELERALDFVRDALSRPPPDRRRALGLLARVLRRRDEPLSAAAADLAWSEPEPAPERMAELADRVGT
jgi:hypothetical protein